MTTRQRGRTGGKRSTRDGAGARTREKRRPRAQADPRRHPARDGSRSGRQLAVGADQVAFWWAGGSVIARLGEGMPVRTGYGGWSTIERPGRVSLTTWTGIEPIEISIPLLFEGWPRRSVESEIAELEAMATVAPDRPRGEAPPVIHVAGGSLPRFPRRALWVISSLEWGDAEWVSRRRVRAAATVVIRQYVDADLVVRKRVYPYPAFHVVRRGESLASIARKVMKARTRAQVQENVRRLKELNRNVRTLRPNQRLRLR
jgi:hypothetical protein